MKTGKVSINGQIILKGYEGEYIFEKIKEKQGFYEWEILKEWAGTYIGPQDVVFDIGANLGNHTVYFGKIAGAGKVYAFESVSENYQLLCENIGINHMENCMTFQLALGDRQENAWMKMEQENNLGTMQLCGEETGESVSVVLLDNLELPLPDFVKIDVEGMELSVLKGMQNILAERKPVLWVEVGSKTAVQVYEFLSGRGYRAADWNISQDNNILFLPITGCAGKESEMFACMLSQAETQLQRYWELKKSKSNFEYEQKKCALRQQELKEAGDRFQKLEQKYEDDLCGCEREILKKNASIVEEKAISGELQATIAGYRTSFLFRMLEVYWSFSKKTAQARHQLFIRAGRWGYYRISHYPGLKALCVRINGKLGIFKNSAVVTGMLQLPKGRSENSQKVPLLKELRVAMIVDEFTYNSFRFECCPLILEPENWRQVMEQGQVDFFFCESVWSGVDTKKRPWKGQIYKSANFHRENRTVLLEILDYCKRRGIPTVFWNKEDPTFYGNQIFDFGDTARRFDHIFTTARECVDRYREEYHHPSVHLLMFATQPKLFNPIETGERSDEIVFAGGWYQNHENRCVQMEQLFDCLLVNGFRLKIYDRYFGTDDPDHQFPTKYHPYLYPGLSHNQMEICYKGSFAALNMNTVTDSDTMFARRVFELMSSNTFVISNASAGMKKLFGEQVLFVEGGQVLSLEGMEEKRRACLNQVLRHHTYRLRFRDMADVLHLPYREERESVSVIYRTDTPSEAAKAFAHGYTVGFSDYKIVFLVGEDSPHVRRITEEFQSREITVYSMAYIRDYLRPAGEKINLDTSHLVFSDGTKQEIFEKQVMLHIQYLDEKTGIQSDDGSFRMETVAMGPNMILPSGCFEQVCENCFSGSEHLVKILHI